MGSFDNTKTIRRLNRILYGDGGHWVGDGFPVRTLFSYTDAGAALSPFLLLDYGGPTEFQPTHEKRGVGAHPHRGFETVTIVYRGQIEHRDSSGGGGTIGSGDVQWMTAASGVVHEEFHGREFARLGGTFEMVQLWVNLPARDKLTPPRYQTILDADIPTINLPEAQGAVRIIAGDYGGEKGPAKTFTPMHVWDINITSNAPIELPVPDGWTAMLVVLEGAATIGGSAQVDVAQVALFDTAGDTVAISGAQGLRALLLCGQPIAEPIVGAGPFVMNTAAEIRQAMLDYQSGEMGRLA